MLYRVFNTELEVAEANGRWLFYKDKAGIHDKKMGQVVNPQITSAWDYGREMLDGRIACQVPEMFADEFGGEEIELAEDDFTIVETEIL
jgi:hypothetical protein